MSRPPVFPEQSASGIAVDPRTLERVVPESRRADGSVRKQLKIRPGYTPQEDVSRFRGVRQKTIDAAALPKGHILGWVAPSSEQQQQKAKLPPPNKNAKRRANQRAKKAAEKEAAIKDNWEDDDDNEESRDAVGDAHVVAEENKKSQSTEAGRKDTGHNKAEGGEDLAEELSKLNIK
ncbi:hypothetical protein V8B97DRAFT_2001926 [Scleroderma yunnanense]